MEGITMDRSHGGGWKALGIGNCGHVGALIGIFCMRLTIPDGRHETAAESTPLHHMSRRDRDYDSRAAIRPFVRRCTKRLRSHIQQFDFIANRSVMADDASPTGNTSKNRQKRRQVLWDEDTSWPLKKFRDEFDARRGQEYPISDHLQSGYIQGTNSKYDSAIGADSLTCHLDSVGAHC
jgi:hypothetical protein